MEVKKLTDATTTEAGKLEDLKLNGWYVVDGEVTAGQLVLTGDTNIILKDDAVLNATDFRDQSRKYNLTFWSEIMGTGSVKLTDSGNVSIMTSGLTVNGGLISATSSANVLYCKNLTVNGGSLELFTTGGDSRYAMADIISINMNNYYKVIAGKNPYASFISYVDWKEGLSNQHKYIKISCMNKATNWEKITSTTSEICLDKNVSEDEALGFVLSKLGEDNIPDDTVVYYRNISEQNMFMVVGWDDTSKKYKSLRTKTFELETLYDDIRTEGVEEGENLYVIGHVIDPVADENKENTAVFNFNDKTFREENVIKDNKLEVTKKNIALSLSGENLLLYEGVMVMEGHNINIGIKSPEHTKIKNIKFYFYCLNQTAANVYAIIPDVVNYGVGANVKIINRDNKTEILADGSPVKIEYDYILGTGQYVAPEGSDIKNFTISCDYLAEGTYLDKIEVEYECVHNTFVSIGNSKHKCKDCGYEETHNMTKTVSTKVDATCTAAGKEAVKECSDCGYTEGGTVIPANGHKYANGVCTVCKAKGKAQKITTAKIKTVKASTLKTKTVKIKLKAKTNGKGKLTYKVSKCPKGMKKFIKVSKKGVVTLKKNAKKGTYKITITAAAKGSYIKTTKVVKIKVK